ncbi:MAG: class I SAM-dependent methyltransferase [Candidatus Cloacimonetes bacterium]|nr:class I SAM-dependent methyltransferase [Candidatus Cloacimonadota bacterium]
MNNPHLEKFLNEQIQIPSPLFNEVRQYALQRGFPLISDDVGQQLQMFASFFDSPKILELGSGFGYSAMWFLEGMSKGEIHLCDFTQANLDLAEGYLKKMGKFSLVKPMYCGNALDYIKNSKSTFDIIFIDIDKLFYLDAIKASVEHLTSGGLIIMDNLFFGGRVYLDDGKKQLGRKSILDAIDFIKQDSRFIVSMIDVGDGLLLAKLR